MRKILRKPLTLVVAVLAVLLALQLMPGVSLLGPGQVSSEGEPQVTTDKPDYGPGETVIITGSGFEASVELTVQITRPDDAVDSAGVTTDGEGGFQYDYVLDGIEGEYLVEVLDGEDNVLASTTFTDSGSLYPKSVTLDGGAAWTATPSHCKVCTGTPGDSVTVAPGASIEVTYEVKGTGCSDWKSTKWDVLSSPQSGCDEFEPDHVHSGWLWCTGFGTVSETWLITAPSTPGTYDLFLWAGRKDNCSWSCYCGCNGKITLEDAIIVEQPEADLTVTVVDGNGSGKVESTLPGIDCESDCEESYAVGTPVDLTATPDPGSFFDGWSDDCSSCGMSATCSVTMSEDKDCTATFTLLQADLEKIELFASPLGQPEVPLPLDFTVSEETVFHLWDEVINNGPIGPAPAVITTTVTAPAGVKLSYHEWWELEYDVQVFLDEGEGAGFVDVTCYHSCCWHYAEPGQTLRVLKFMDIPVTPEPLLVPQGWDIHCLEPSNHEIHWENSIALTDEEWEDPESGNNTADLYLPIECWADVDVQVSQEFIDPPTEMDVSDNVVVTVKKTITATVLNNPPHNIPSVTVSITKTATAPDGCTVTPDGYVHTQEEVLTTEPKVLTETFTIHCEEPSLHTFTFKNVVSAPKDAHIVDPNLPNEDTIPLPVEVTGYVDVQVSQEFVNPPTVMDVSDDVVVTVKKTITATVTSPTPHNIPSVTVNITKTATAPDGCTVTPDGYVHTQEVVSTTEPKELIETFTIHCEEPSLHTFTFTNVVSAPKDAHIVDPNLPNEDTIPLPVTVIGRVDVQVSQEFVDPPDDIYLSEDVVVTVKKTITATVKNEEPHNIPSVTVDITKTASAPTDCTVIPDGYVHTQEVVSTTEPMVLTETFTIHCYKRSTHGPFTFTNVVTEPKDAHVVDDYPDNNTATPLPLTVDVYARTDLKILSQSVPNAPEEIPVSEDVVVFIEKVLHNNGPDASEEAETTTDVTVPADCEVSPTVHIQQFADVPVSVDIIHQEPFTIHCNQPSTHTFTFGNEVEVKEVHAVDLVPGNNALVPKTELTVDAIAEADVKIVSASWVDPPSVIGQGTNTDVTLRKTIHNNGPWEPVDISQSGEAWAPPGCTAVVKDAPSKLNVALSVDVTVDEVWTINCSVKDEDLSFSFDDTIDVETTHVRDSTQGNNEVHMELRLASDPPPYPFGSADICDGLDNDGDTYVDEGWDGNGNEIGDCLDPDLDTDGDTVTNDEDTDDDGDGFSDALEGWMGTDPLYACPISSIHAAWPLDQDNDATVIIGDVLAFRGTLFLSPGDPGWDRRLDLDGDGAILIGDVLLYRGFLFATCP